MTPIRLFVDAALYSDALIEATAMQAHYLGSVMRRSAGDSIVLFNGRDGAWGGAIATLSRGRATLRVQTLLRPQAAEPDLWLVFALLKRDATDLVVQKATELGISALLPVTTERTNAVRVNLERLQAIAIEAAEQSERMSVPSIAPVRTLHEILSDWPDERPLYVALERDRLPPPVYLPGAKGVLIGPEGGFGARDRSLLKGCPFIRPISLGSTILRAETAAIVALALLQAPGWG